MTTTQKNKDSSLVRALINGSPQVVKRLLKEGADANAQGGEFNSPALVLAMLGSQAVRVKNIEALLAHGANPNWVCPEKKTHVSPFMRACMRGDNQMVSAMLDSSGSVKVDLLLADDHGWIPSMAAALNCSTDVLAKMQALFERVTLPLQPDLPRHHLWTCADQHGRSAIMQISEQANLRWILGQNFKDQNELLEARDKEGKTALWIAVLANDSEHVKTLLGLGTRTDVKDASGQSLLEMASRRHVAPNEEAIRANIMTDLRAFDSARAAVASIDEVMALHPKSPPSARAVAF